MKKAYANKELRFDLQGSESETRAFSEGDLFELFGNLLDNASKWSNSSVQVQVTYQNNIWRISVEDDGKGFPSEFTEKKLQRGLRMDERGGQGIGLAVVQSIVSAYHGKLTLCRSHLGGANVTIEFSDTLGDV